MFTLEILITVNTFVKLLVRQPNLSTRHWLTNRLGGCHSCIKNITNNLLRQARNDEHRMKLSLNGHPL